METDQAKGSTEYDVLSRHCPTRDVLDRIGNRWTMLVILALQPGTLRFSAIRARVEGVTQKMLTQTLRALERDGLIRRQVHPTVPVTVEYTLTELGSSLATAVDPLRAWAYTHIDEVERARRSYNGSSATN